LLKGIHALGANLYQELRIVTILGAVSPHF